MDIHDERKAVVLINELLSLSLRASAFVPYNNEIHDDIVRLLRRAKTIKPYADYFNSIHSEGTTVDQHEADKVCKKA